MQHACENIVFEFTLLQFTERNRNVLSTTIWNNRTTTLLPADTKVTEKEEMVRNMESVILKGDSIFCVL